MNFKTSLKRKLSMAVNDKTALNRNILVWNKSLREVEKVLSRSKQAKK